MPNEPLPRICEACQEVRKDVDDMESRLRNVEKTQARISEGFPKNDLGSPDYDGHRVAHVNSIEKAKVVQGYQRDLTKKVLEWLLVAIAVLVGQGAVEWLKAHIK